MAEEVVDQIFRQAPMADAGAQAFENVRGHGRAWALHGIENRRLAAVKLG